MDRAEIVGLLEIEKQLTMSPAGKLEWVQKALNVLLKAELERIDYAKYQSQ